MEVKKFSEKQAKKGKKGVITNRVVDIKNVLNLITNMQRNRKLELCLRGNETNFFTSPIEDQKLLFGSRLMSEKMKLKRDDVELMITRQTAYLNTSRAFDSFGYKPKADDLMRINEGKKISKSGFKPSINSLTIDPPSMSPINANSFARQSANKEETRLK